MTRVNPASGSTGNLTSQSLTAVSIQPPALNPDLSLAYRSLNDMGAGSHPVDFGGPFAIRQYPGSSVPPLPSGRPGLGHPLGQVLVAQNGASEETPAQAPPTSPSPSKPKPSLVPGGEPILTSGGVPSTGNSNSAGTVMATPPVPQPATATAPAIELVTQRTRDSKKLIGSINIGNKRDTLTIAKFLEVILAADKYPLTATYMGVDALEESSLLGINGKYHIVYQRTGGLWPVDSRHYVIAMSVKSETDDRVEIEWYLVKIPRHKKGKFLGPYAANLNKNDAVYTPYNRGSWVYDRKAGKITYTLDTDTGGSLPTWMTTKGAMMAFPQELLKKQWGIEGDLE